MALAWVDDLLCASPERIDEVNRGPLLHSAFGVAAGSFLFHMMCGCVDNDLPLRILVAIR